uniref:Uncharacterized protein n=1 Tax=Oryza sativa subsp. japonica TaxID=39947 RepID=Q84JN7_ORYSJ|nr:hypothetical protein [Oryza sativa Japonica Group]BAC57310.1 hypothetical protein [Oryza sativa Japonica Group]
MLLAVKCMRQCLSFVNFISVKKTTRICVWRRKLYPPIVKKLHWDATGLDEKGSEDQISQFLPSGPHQCRVGWTQQRLVSDATWDQ